MAVVDAFGTLTGTINAGVTAYFRATGCTSITIADVLPLLSKITTYADEYVIGEMKIWDSGTEQPEPDNCVMVRVIVYNDGWMCAWFDKESFNQFTGSAFAFVDTYTLSGFGTHIDYPDQWNGCYLKVTNSNGVGADDPECPDNTVFCIQETDFVNGRLKIHKDYSANNYHFNTGNTYDVDVYMSNGNLVWWGHDSSFWGIPSNLSNRLYRAISEMWVVLKYSTNTTITSDYPISRATLDDDDSFNNFTAAFNNATINDVQLIPSTEEVNDAFYFGYTNKFNGLNLNIGTAGVGNTIAWEYWDGSVWSALSVTDTTSGFTVVGTNTVIFTPPDDWEKVIVNAYEYFWIRSRVSVAAFTTQPLLTQGWVIVPVNIGYTNTNLGMYSFEDTSANYCLICGISKIVSSTRYHYYFYNTSLLGKTIYNHTVNYGYKQTGSSVEFNINDHKRSLSDIHSNGYISENIESIDGAVGIQNTYHYNTNYTYANGAAILIVS